MRPFEFGVLCGRVPHTLKDAHAPRYSSVHPPRLSPVKQSQLAHRSPPYHFAYIWKKEKVRKESVPSLLQELVKRPLIRENLNVIQNTSPRRLMPHLLHQMVQNRTNLEGHSIQIIIITTKLRHNTRPQTTWGLARAQSTATAEASRQGRFHRQGWV